jgi:hypothetical protein
MIQLPDIATDPGVLSRLMIAECENPGYPDYDESDGQLSFRLMQAVIANRLSNNPSQFGAPGATTYADIITAPNQFQGFTMSGGQVQVSQPVSDRIDTVMTDANTGSPGAYYQFAQDILTQVNGAVNDPFAGVTSINGTAVQGGTYGWRTVGSGDPGGNFFAIPAALGGVVLGNQFYTLLATSSSLTMERKEKTPSLRTRFKDGVTFLNFLKSGVGSASRVSLHGYVKAAEKEGIVLFTRNLDHAKWTEISVRSIQGVEYYGEQPHGDDGCAEVLLSF